MTWTTIAITVAIVLGAGGIIRGWQMGYRNRLDLISDWDHRPLPNPSLHARAFARVYLAMGGILVAMPALLFLGLHIYIWCAITAVLVWYWFYAIDSITEKARATK